MTLRIVGQHKGSVELNLETATVLELKEAISRSSDLAVSGLKLLAGGKHLKNEGALLAQCGITTGQTIIVLRQDHSTQLQAEAGINRRTEEVVQAASLLSARAARDVGAGGRGNAWGAWGRGREGGRGRGRRGGGRHDYRPQIELTNQDGEALAIPQEDSAALMEGIMLHRQGLSCLQHMGRALPATIAPPSPAANTLEHVASPYDEAEGTDPTTASQPSGIPSSPHTRTSRERQADDTSQASTASSPPGSVEEQKSSEPQEKIGSDRERSEDDAKVDQSAEQSPVAACSEGQSRETGGEFAEGKGGVDPAEEVTSGTRPTARKVGKGKGKVTDGKAGRTPFAAEKRLVQREALGLLMRADEAFQRCNPKYLDMVDNYAYLCLDIVWLLFLMKDMSNLDLASRMLGSVERGFRKAHGPGLQRLTALKGEYCAEKLLYVRLHLLQGVVAFLQGDSGKASGLLIRASEEARTLRPNPALAARLVQQWRAMKFETLQPKVALRALRVGRNDLDAAWQYLEGLRTRQDNVAKERQRRREQRQAERFGLTADKKGFVAASLVDQLADAGFTRNKAIRALRQHNNDVEAALASLTSDPKGMNNTSGSSNDESLAVLQSLGVLPDAARDVLARTGSLCDALRELGIDTPESANVGTSSDSTPGQGSNATASAGGVGGGCSGGSGGTSNEGDDQGEREEPGPTAEEMKLFDELAGDRDNEDEEGYLDIALEDEADAADMYLHLCKGNIPVAFDLAKVRAKIGEATAEGASGLNAP